MSDLGELHDEVDDLIDSLGQLTGRQRVLAATARRLSVILFDPDERAKAAIAKELRAVIAELTEGADHDDDDAAGALIARLSAKVGHRSN